MKYAVFAVFAASTAFTWFAVGIFVATGQFKLAVIQLVLSLLNSFGDWYYMMRSQP